MDRFKFRVWDEKANKYDDAYMLFITIEGALKHKVMDKMFTIEQCTGLKDKNGKLIYEGDRIRWIGGKEQGIGRVEYFCHSMTCMWEDDNFLRPSIYTAMKYLGCEKELEIIGNIHEEQA